MPPSGKTGISHVEDIVVVQVFPVSDVLHGIIVCTVDINKLTVSIPLHFGGWRIRRATRYVEYVVLVTIIIAVVTSIVDSRSTWNTTSHVVILYTQTVLVLS